MTWVYRNGRMVERSSDEDFSGSSARSSLPCPNVIRDGMDPLQHQANGRMYDSKRAMARADKEEGCICIGNEVQKPTAPGKPELTRDDVGRALQKVRAGYKPAIHTEQLSRDIESGFI